MNYNNLIHQFLDGDIDSLSEDLLFSKLSQDSELREIFKQQVQLHLLAQNDMSAITTPSESTSYIFSSIGLSVPTVDSPANKQPLSAATLEKQIHSNYNKYLSTALTAIISVALTTLFFLINPMDFHSPNPAVAEALMANEKSIKYPITSNFEIDNNDNIISKAKSSAVEKISKKSDIATHTNSNEQDLEKASFTFSEKRESNQNLSISKNENEVLLALKPSSIPEKNMNTKANKSSLVEGALFGAYNIDLNNLGKFGTNDTKISLQWRNISTSSSGKSSELPSSKEPLFINQGLALVYKLDENNAFGFEIGQEHFLQQFTRKIGEQEYSYTQNPVLFWYGGFYKLSLPSIGYKNITPFTQVFAGGTSAGIIGRAQLGVQYNYDNFLQFYISAEFSSLFYNIQSNINRTDKTGISYGLSLSY
ncbi:MAG: hypothetical protein GX121_08570 [Ignavibacteria bacterium]|jgi:hypothetical protein|nr:hypothetical protein [Ignavibacteria bacterium]